MSPVMQKSPPVVIEISPPLPASGTTISASRRWLTPFATGYFTTRTESC